MQDLKTTTGIVRSILEKNKQARNSDSLLYLEVLKHHAKQKGLDLWGMPVPFFLEHASDMGLPGFETVRRSRQKVQATFPHLASSERVAEFRALNEQEFKAYAVGGIE